MNRPFSLEKAMDEEIQKFEKLLRHYIPADQLEACLEQILSRYRFDMANYALAAIMDSEVQREAEEICREQMDCDPTG